MIALLGGWVLGINPLTILSALSGGAPTAQVQQVLAEIGAEGIPQLLVFNKTDALPPEQRPLKLVDEYEVDGVQTPRVFVSARKLEGLAELRQQLSAVVAASMPAVTGAEDAPENHGDAS